MKRLLALFVCLMSMGTCLAESNAFNSMSTEELIATVDTIRNELLSRELDASGAEVFLEGDSIKVYRDNDQEIRINTSAIYIPVIVVNDTSAEIALRLDKVRVNGWDCSGIMGNVSANGKMRDNIYINVTGAGLQSESELEDVEFVITAFNRETAEYDVITEKLIFTFNN